MKKYEYKMIKVTQSGFWNPKLDIATMEIELNKLGFEGWELISVADTNFYEGATKEIILFFKRESRF